MKSSLLVSFISNFTEDIAPTIGNSIEIDSIGSIILFPYVILLVLYERQKLVTIHLGYGRMQKN